MLCFVDSSLIEEICLTKTHKLSNQHKKGKKKGLVKSDINSETYDYSSLIDYFIISLIKLFDNDVQLLWEPPMIEDELFRLIINFCFKLMENVENSKNKSLLKSITTLFGKFLIKHNVLLSKK